MTGTTGTDTVLMDVSDGVGKVVLNRPDRLNAAVPDMLTGLRRGIDHLAGRSDVRVVVLTGAGRAFCAGADLAQPTLDDPSGRRLRHDAGIVEALAGLPQITLAVVNGACAGLGLALAAACDLRVARAGAVFTTAYLTAGLPGDFGGTWTLSRLLGPAAAAALYLLPDRMTAEQAWSIGLLSAKPGEDIDGLADQTIARLTGAAPLALAAIKQNLREAAELDLPAYLDRESRRHARVRASHDAAEARQAFLGRRPPTFHGR